MFRKLIIPAACAVVISVAGCGGGNRSDEQQVADVLNKFIAHVQDGNTGGACSLTVDTGECLGVLGLASAFAGGEEGLKALVESEGGPPNYAASEVTVTGTTAVANDKGGDADPQNMRKVKDRWKLVIDLDEEDDEAVAANEPDAAPTLDDIEDEIESEQAHQTTVGIGEPAVDDDITFKVNSIEVVSSVPTDGILDEGAIAPRKGAKLIAVDVTYKNNTTDGVDLFCGGNSIVLLDREQRNFDPMDNYTEIAGNTICGDDIQPGFKTTNTILFTIPRDAYTGGVVLWNSDADGDFSGDATNIFVSRS